MMEIRKYDPLKDESILEFLNDHTIIRIGSDYMSALLDKETFANLFLPDGLCLAVADNAIIGALLVGLYKELDSQCVAVYGIKIDESYRRYGIGSHLMQKATEFAESIGINRIFLETRPDNAPALALFNKLGYQVFESSINNVKLEKRWS